MSPDSGDVGVGGEAAPDDVSVLRLPLEPHLSCVSCLAEAVLGVAEAEAGDEALDVLVLSCCCSRGADTNCCSRTADTGIFAEAAGDGAVD